MKLKKTRNIGGVLVAKAPVSLSVMAHTREPVYRLYNTSGLEIEKCISADVKELPILLSAMAHTKAEPTHLSMDQRGLNLNH